VFYCLWCAHAHVFTYVVYFDVRMRVCLGAYFGLGVRVYVGLCVRVCTSMYIRRTDKTLYRVIHEFRR
jgi:hypothetical protein